MGRIFDIFNYCFKAVNLIYIKIKHRTANLLSSLSHSFAVSLVAYFFRYMYMRDLIHSLPWGT